jgi:hypothetical protein
LALSCSGTGHREDASAGHKFAFISLLQFNVKATTQPLLRVEPSLFKLLDGGHLYSKCSGNKEFTSCLMAE